MSSIYKIQAVAMIQGKTAHFELVFDDEKEASKTCDFLKNLEEIVALEYASVTPLSFEEFKRKLGEHLDNFYTEKSETDLRDLDTANTVAA